MPTNPVKVMAFFVQKLMAKVIMERTFGLLHILSYYTFLEIRNTPDIWLAKYLAGKKAFFYIW